jgi:CHAT domain-containing protein
MIHPTKLRAASACASILSAAIALVPGFLSVPAATSFAMFVASNSVRAQQPAAPAAEPAPAPVEAPPPRTIEDIVQVLEQYKPNPAAIEAARAVLAAPVLESGDRQALFRQHYQRGVAARKLSDDSTAIIELRKAREHLPIGQQEAIWALADLANAEFQSGNALNSVEIMKQVMTIIPQNMAGYLITASGGGALTHGQLGDFEGARAYLRTAENTFSRISRGPNFAFYRHQWTAGLEFARGEVFFAEGKLAEAEAAYRKALREMELDKPDREQRTRQGMTQGTDENSEAGRTRNLRRLGMTLLRAGRANEAEINIRLALKASLERVGRYSPDTILNLQAFAQILIEQGRFAEGALMAREAVRSVEGAGIPQHAFVAINARRALGAALVSNGKWSDALATFDEMRRNAEKEPELARKIARGDLDWAHALLKMNRGPEARAMLQNMLELNARLYGDKDQRTALVRGFHAIALEKTGARSDALTEFAKAMPILIDQIRNDMAADSGSVRQVRRATYVIENYIELLARARQAGLAIPGGIDAVAESFRLADVARGSEVQRALSASAARSNISDPALAELARKEQDAQRRISSLSDILRSLQAAPPAQQLPSVIAQMRKDVDQLTVERNTLKRDIERRFPEYAELVDPKPVSVALVQSALRTGETMISIYLGEDAAFVWAVPKSGAAMLTTAALSSAQIAKTVESLRKALDPQATSIDEIPAFDVAGAAKLYEDLLKPVEATWKGSSQHLLIVPHGALGQLPMGLLPTSNVVLGKEADIFAEYRKVPWLIRETALTQLPSVTALATLRRTQAPRGERRMYLGIGDPYFSKEQAGAALQLASATPAGATTSRGAAARSTATRGTPIHLRSAPRTDGVSSAELGLLPRLPDTEDELTEIAKTLGADLVKDLLLHKDANEKNVKTMNLADRRIVHFATHGLVPGELNGLTQPALALTAPDVAGIDGDGLLTMDDILALKLNADWVVLSACNTASGDGAGSEAVSGLGRAFFYAGARALLVSNWPVDSVAARRLMTDLFKRYAAGPATAKSGSLRAAMLALMDSPGFLDPSTGKTAYSYAHPLFWAPFVLVGD